MNAENRSSFVIWDNENDAGFITVKSKSTGECFGLFLLSSSPTEIVVNPKTNRLIFRLMT